MKTPHPSTAPDTDTPLTALTRRVGALEQRLAQLEPRTDRLEVSAAALGAPLSVSDPLPVDRATLEARLEDVRIKLDEAIQAHGRATERFHAWADNPEQVRAAYALMQDCEALEGAIVDRLAILERR